MFFWVYFPSFSRYRELKQQEEKLTADIADLDGKIQALIEERRLLQDDLDYIEKVIRDELGLVKPGEIVYKMVPQEEKPQPKTDENADAESPMPVSETAQTGTSSSR
ncbi:MAG: septum formation initiator family protein [Candidatus Omnitrophica bacterium]|nr:septum formation initiator family protein [Candidatus Omnitrophota bacterium]